MRYDLAVIGGGLAGLSLAILQAKAGRQVVLLEQKKYPAHKVCGEYISLESWAFLEQLGVPLSDWDLPIIQRLQLTAPARSLDLPLDLGGFGVSRYQLEMELLALAKALGVQVEVETKVLDITRHAEGFELRHSAGTVEARQAAGSWGRRSVLHPQPVQKRNYVGIKWHLEGPLPADLIALHNFSGGYAGMSRIEAGKSCFCYLVDSRKLREAGSIPALEASMRRENKFLDAALQQLQPLWEQPLTISQLSFSPKATAHAGVFLLGDAAGSIAPLTGNGMSMAMHAAYLLHLVLQKQAEGSLSPAQAYASYDRLWKAHFARRTQLSHRIQHLFGRNTLTHGLLAAVAASPFLGRQLMKLTHGRDILHSKID